MNGKKEIIGKNKKKTYLHCRQRRRQRHRHRYHFHGKTADRPSAPSDYSWEEVIELYTPLPCSCGNKRGACSKDAKDQDRFAVAERNENHAKINDKLAKEIG